MIYTELSENAKRRIKYNGVCPICSQPILKSDTFQYLTYNCSKRKEYVFFHLACLIKARREVNQQRI